ncbi:SH3 domain-containing protein [Pelagibacterium halotolerans]|uniref:SH3 domain-containing protein n=1 Tax=Pelagibacterium halotolerans TaxID=531813 RepID=UPI00384F0353
MAFRKTAIRSGLAAMMMLAMTAGAFAWQASAVTSLNVRSGPGTQFRVLDALYAGERVDVEYCRGGWCFIHQYDYDPSGWVSANYLREGGYYRPQPPIVIRPPVVVRPPHWNPRPPHWWHRLPDRPPHWNWNDDSDISGTVCFNGPNGRFCVGGSSR